MDEKKVTWIRLLASKIGNNLYKCSWMSSYLYIKIHDSRKLIAEMLTFLTFNQFLISSKIIVICEHE